MICDLCYFENYVCNYEFWFYKLDTQDRAICLEMFLRKLPYDFQSEIRMEWEKAIASGASSRTLGGLIRTIQGWIVKQCRRNKLKGKFKDINRICCDPSDYKLPGR